MYHISNQLNNIFDQYDQSENRITNAFLQTLAQDTCLLTKFLNSCITHRINKDISIAISSQKEPFVLGDSDDDKERVEGIPDGWIVVGEDEALVIESKIFRNAIRKEQLFAHVKRIKTYKNKYLCVITPDDESPVRDLHINGVNIVWFSWKNIYEMIDNDNPETLSGFLRSQLKEYLAMSEDLVGFQGINFASGEFNLRDARLIMRNLVKQIKPDIVKIFPKLTFERKTYTREVNPHAITTRGVWAFIAADKSFTHDIHLTFWMTETHFGMGITVPHGARARWRRVKKVFKSKYSFNEFVKLLSGLRKKLPNVYLEFVHRHYKQRREGIMDGYMEIDIDTMAGKGPIKANARWLAAIRELVANKEGYNGQFMVRTRFFYEDQADVRKAKFKDIIIETASHFKELYEFLSI